MMSNMSFLRAKVVASASIDELSGQLLLRFQLSQLTHGGWFPTGSRSRSRINSRFFSPLFSFSLFLSLLNKWVKKPFLNPFFYFC